MRSPTAGGSSSLYIEPTEEEFEIVVLTEHPEIVKDLLKRIDESSTEYIITKVLDILERMGAFTFEDGEHINALIYALFHNGIYAIPESNREINPETNKPYILLRLRRVRLIDPDPNPQATNELIEKYGSVI